MKATAFNNWLQPSKTAFSRPSGICWNCYQELVD